MRIRAAIGIFVVLLAAAVIATPVGLALVLIAGRDGQRRSALIGVVASVAAWMVIIVGSRIAEHASDRTRNRLARLGSLISTLAIISAAVAGTSADGNLVLGFGFFFGVFCIGIAALAVRNRLAHNV